jgi:hypothetical protein
VTAAVSYVIELPGRPNGHPASLFTRGTISLAPGEPPELHRRYAFRSDVDPVVRPDAHAVELIVNGKRVACANFCCAPDRAPSSLKHGRRPASGPLKLAQ